MSNIGMRKLTKLIFNHKLINIESASIKKWRMLNPLASLINDPDMSSSKMIVHKETSHHECFYEVYLKLDGSFYDCAYFYSSTGTQSKLPCIIFNSYHPMFNSVLEVLSGKIQTQQTRSLKFSSHCTGFIGFSEQSRFFFVWRDEDMNQKFFGAHAGLNQTLFNAFKAAIIPSVEEGITAVVVD